MRSTPSPWTIDQRKGAGGSSFVIGAVLPLFETAIYRQLEVTMSLRAGSALSSATRRDDRTMRSLVENGDTELRKK